MDTPGMDVDQGKDQPGPPEETPKLMQNVHSMLKALPMSEAHASLIIIDSRTIIREALCSVIQTAVRKQVLALGDLGDIESLASTVNSPDTIIMYSTVDGALDRIRGELTNIQAQMDQCRLCLLTDQLGRDFEELFDDFELHGIIPSSFDTKQLLACLQIIESGVPFLPVALHDPNRHLAEAAETDDAHFNELLKKLTPRQQQVMRYIAIGRSNKYIAAELSLCESTVKVHVSELMKRLGATSRTHAVYLLNRRLGAARPATTRRQAVEPGGP